MTAIAVQMWTVRNKAEADMAATLRELKAIGLATVEAVNAMNALPAPQMRHLLDDAGISLCAVHARLPESDSPDDLEKLCSEVVELGAPALVVSSLREEHFADDAAVMRAAERMNTAAKLTGRWGLELGYHNHWWEFENKLKGKSAYETFVELLDPAIALEVDTYWAQVGGVDAATLVSSLGERVHYLHVKDGPVDHGSPQCALGQGQMDVPGVLGANPAVRWHVIELDEFDGDVFDAVRDSFAYLKSLGR